MKRIFLILCFGSILSCETSNSKKRNYEAANDTLPSHDAESLTPEAKATDEAFVARRSMLLKIVNLNEDTIRNPELRIWVGAPTVNDSGNLIILKKRDANWSAELHSFSFNVSHEGVDFVQTHKVVEKSPKSSWSMLVDEINSTGIYNLNDRGRSKNNGLCVDGPSVEVEIVKDKIHDEFVYPCWDIIEDQSQLDKVRNLLRLVEKEFGFGVSNLLPKREAPKVVSEPVEYSEVNIKENKKGY